MSWKTVELGEICDITNGSTPLRTTKDFWENGTVNWFTIEDIRKFGREINQTTQFITEQALKKTSLKIVPINTVLLCCTASVGEYAITKIPLTMNQQFNGLILKTDNVLPQYLFHYCSTLKEKLISVSGSTTINFVAISKLKKITINIPTIATQQKIVTKLDAIFAEIDTATAAAEANTNNAEALFQSYLTEIFERGGEGWETKKLCEVSSFDKNQGLHNGIPYIGLENIQSHTTQLISGVELVEEVKSLTFKFNETHLLYGRLRPYLNKVYTPDFVGHCSTEIFPIKPFSNLLRAYLKYWLINAKTVDRINATCTGARMPRANMNAVMEFDFPLPPISIQKQLIEYFDSVQNYTLIAIDSYKAKIAELTALKQSILQKAFSGELVKD